MKFNVQKVVMPLALSDYHESYKDLRLLVWVNPPRDVRTARESILNDYSALLNNKLAPMTTKPAKTDEAGIFSKIKAGLKLLSTRVEIASEFVDLNQRMFAWLAQIWNQHSDETSTWSVTEIQTLYDAEPALYQWMVKHTIRMMDEFAQDVKKKIEADVAEAQKTGLTRAPMLAAIYLSEYINRRNGGVLVAPWDLHELPEEWLTTYRLLQAQDAQTKKKNAMEGMFQSFRQKHPTYRKY